MTDFQKSVTKLPMSKKSENIEFWIFRPFKQKRDLASLGVYFGCSKQKWSEAHKIYFYFLV
jgi:hypothetical protein